MTALRWIKEGDPLPKDTRLLQVLMRERRPTLGGGTASEEWLLCEFEILDSAGGGGV